MRLWILVIASLALPNAGWARSYELKVVSYASSVAAVAINDQGEVAWATSVGSGTWNLLRASPGDAPTTIDTVPSGTRIYLDDQGFVGFEQDGGLRRNDGSGPEILWNFSDGTFDGQTFVSFLYDLPYDLWMMNRAGTFAFLSTFSSDGSPFDNNDNIFYGPEAGPPFANFATDPGAPFPGSDAGTQDVASLAIGADSTVAFSENQQYCAPPCLPHSHLIRMQGADVQDVIVGPPDRYSSFDVFVQDVNGHGDVLFEAYDDVAQASGIYVSRCCGAHDSELVVADDGAYSRLRQGFFNDARTPAFLATISGDPTQHPSGIFSGPDPVADKVIALADGLQGGTIEPATLILGGINNAGQIAFAATVDQGQAAYGVVMRADPVPEPANTMEADATALSALVLICRTRVRRGRCAP